jgi:hypothetical protein
MRHVDPMMSANGFTKLSALLVALALAGCIPTASRAKPEAGSSGDMENCGWSGCPEGEGDAEMPKEAFPSVEPVLAALADRWAKEHEHKITIKRTYTAALEWGVTRHEVSGRIIGRVTKGVIFTHDATNQKCWQLLCNVRQDELGGRWGAPYMECPWTMTVRCESVDALPEKR